MNAFPARILSEFLKNCDTPRKIPTTVDFQSELLRHSHKKFLWNSRKASCEFRRVPWGLRVPELYPILSEAFKGSVTLPKAP